MCVKGTDLKLSDKKRVNGIGTEQESNEKSVSSMGFVWLLIT